MRIQRVGLTLGVATFPRGGHLIGGYRFRGLDNTGIGRYNVSPRLRSAPDLGSYGRDPALLFEHALTSFRTPNSLVCALASRWTNLLPRHSEAEA